jgi:hypothetical protein
MDAPNLIESSAKNYLFNTLKQCHGYRVNVYYYALNIGVFILFVLIFGLTLYYCNKQKMTDYEKQQKMLSDQQYVMSKIRYYKEETKHAQDSSHSSITNLPYLEA